MQIKRAEASARNQMYNDGGGLYLFCRTYGGKQWIFRYTSPLTNSRRKQSLGSFPTTSLKEARNRAKNSRELLEAGSDPIKHEQERLELEEEKRKAQQDKNVNTVQNIFVIYKREELQNRQDKGASVERVFKKDVFPVIGLKPIHEVSRVDVKTILDRPLSRNSKRMANETLSNLKQFFGYAEDEELINRDPTRRLIKSRVGGKEPKRKRVLSDKELYMLKEKMPLSGLLPHYQHAILLYLATACRRTELAHQNFKDIDLDNRNLYISSDRAKNTDEHNIYLSDFALKQINAIASLTDNDEWLLPNLFGNGPIGKSVLTKQIVDRQFQPDKRKKSKGRANNDLLALSTERWILHDLRRTAATIMQRCGVMPHIVKKCLNQRTDDPIMETYQRAELIEEQKQAFIKLGEYLSQIFD